MTRSFWAPAVLVILAGLVLLLSAGGGWIDGFEERPVGNDLVVLEEESISGTQFAPTAVVFGLGGLLVGVVLAVVRGRARRVVAALALALGLAAAGVVAQGITRAMPAEGSMTPAPIFAALGAVAIGLGGVLALRAPARPPQTSRYRVEGERPEDDEWNVATGDSE